MLKHISLKNPTQVAALQAAQLVLVPVQTRMNGHAILRRGLAAVFAAKARQVGVDLEALVSTKEPTFLPPEEAKELGAPYGLLFVPAVDLDTGSVDWSRVAEAVTQLGQAVIVPYWDDESRLQAELTGGIPVYSGAEAFRSNGLNLAPDWDKEGSIFLTTHPKVRVRMEVAEAFIRSAPATIVTLARVSNIPFVQAALIAGKRVIVLDPGLLNSWREETKALLNGAEVIKTAEVYGPGAVTSTVRWAIAHTAKSFGVEPDGLRSEAGLCTTNLWPRVKALAQVNTAKEEVPF
ncbi:hypothetical protein [Thermus phage TSP4]|nr:hypothetical protein [Thermus phage TSP4]